MTQVNRIRELFFEKGLNYAEISRVTGSDVKTVKKYIHQEDFNPPPPEVRENRPSKLDQYKKDIDEWLEEDKQARKKQRHTARRILQRLEKKHGAAFDCSYRLVADYVAEKKRKLERDHHHQFGVRKWVNIFYDEQMTAAMIDRLVHHSYLLLFKGPSHRTKTH